MNLPIPPGEPPADEVAAALADLAAARAERDAAAHVIALIRINGRPEGGAGGGLFLRRREIELQVAETRLQLWAGEVRQTEAAVRRLGIRP